MGDALASWARVWQPGCAANEGPDMTAKKRDGCVRPWVGSASSPLVTSRVTKSSGLMALANRRPKHDDGTAPFWR